MGKGIANVIATDAMTDLHSDFFKKSHRLVFSQLALSPVEHDIFALFLTKLNKEQWQSFLNKETIESPQYNFSSDVICEWFGIEKKYLYSTLRDPARRLSGKMIGVMDDTNKRFKFRTLFKEVMYENGELTIVPNDRLINEYLSISQGHSQVPHKTFRNIQKEHAKRLYTMLCRFKDEHTGLHPQTIEDLHAFFGLLDDKGKLLKKTYAVTGNLINRIIKPAILEIDEKESLIEFFIDEKTGNYGFSYQKRGRKVIAIKFLFRWRKKVNKAEAEERNKLANQLPTFELALLTYQIVLEFTEEDSGNPSVEELNNLMANAGALMENSKMLDAEFMIKFAMAMNEAKKRASV